MPDIDFAIYFDIDDRDAPWTCRLTLPGLTAEVKSRQWKDVWMAGQHMLAPAFRQGMFGGTPLALRDKPVGVIAQANRPELNVGDLVELPGLPGVGAVIENASSDPRYVGMVTVDWGGEAPEKHVYHPGLLELVQSAETTDDLPEDGMDSRPADD